jgi:Cu(I)/Ag(I) efflux system membrane fusion protein/cobalt-zinc-cadmium efflux system membrane fusion protein
MYVSVDISAPLGRQLVIPASGVLQAGSRQIAFIDRGQGSLEPREIETGPTLDDSVIVLKGLKAGDRIVSSANFLVDSEAQLQSAMGSFTPAPQPAGTGSQQATAQLQIDFITEPNPPRKGAHTVHVRLTDPGGKPVSGVQAAITFFMPAMPAMGMAAQRASASLAEKGNGNYESLIHLDTGGTWQVTITIQRAGTTIATKQLSVSAAGGM